MNYELRIKNIKEWMMNIVRRVFIIHNSRFNIQNKGGFTLLISVVLASLLLSIGLAVFNSTFKGLELSSLGRDSQFAFYAADAGMECALYWDVRGGVFATSTRSTPPTSGVLCARQDISESWDITSGTEVVTTSFQLVFLPEDSCATVVVEKTNDSGSISTIIESRGYNTCDTASTRRVERAIRTSYDQ